MLCIQLVVSDDVAASGPTSGYKLTYRGFSIVFTVRNMKWLIVITAARGLNAARVVDSAHVPC